MKFRVWDRGKMYYPDSGAAVDGDPAVYMVEANGSVWLSDYHRLWRRPEAIAMPEIGPDCNGRMLYEQDLVRIRSGPSRDDVVYQKAQIAGVGEYFSNLLDGEP